MAEDALAGGGVGVGVDEATDLRIVVTALEVIQPRLLGIWPFIGLFLGRFQAAFQRSKWVENSSNFPPTRDIISS